MLAGRQTVSFLLSLASLARDGEDDVKARCDSSCLTQGVAEMLRRRYSGEMFEAVALFLGTYAVLEG